MNKKQHHGKSNPNSNSSFPENNNLYRNTRRITNDIIDIDDSPDVATWNKEVTRNKDHMTKDTRRSEETNEKYRNTKSTPEIPPTTTIGLRKENNDDKDDQVDPANQKDLDKIYNSGGKLTDQANLFNNKRKFNKSQKK